MHAKDIQTRLTRMSYYFTKKGPDVYLNKMVTGELKPQKESSSGLTPSATGGTDNPQGTSKQTGGAKPNNGTGGNVAGPMGNQQQGGANPNKGTGGNVTGAKGNQQQFEKELNNMKKGITEIHDRVSKLLTEFGTPDESKQGNISDIPTTLVIEKIELCQQAASRLQDRYKETETAVSKVYKQFVNSKGAQLPGVDDQVRVIWEFLSKQERSQKSLAAPLHTTMARKGKTKLTDLLQIEQQQESGFETIFDELDAPELGSDEAKSDETWKKICDVLRLELHQTKTECDRRCSLLEKDKKDLKKSNAVLAQKEQYHDALKTRNVEIMQELAKVKKEMYTLHPAYENYYQHASNLREAYHSAQKFCAKLNHEKMELDKYNKQLVGEQEMLEENLNLMNKENVNLVLRLSKVAGDRLTAGNPNIADLSDVHRPTKLAEDFSELYDNEWTDAFEEAPMDTEKDKVTFLFNLLKRSYELCLAESGDLFKHVLSQHASSVVYGIDQLEFTVPEHKNVAKSDTETKVQTERNDMETKDSMETALDTVKQTGRGRPVNIESTTQDVESDVDKYPEYSSNGGAAADDDHEDSMSTREGRDVDITDVGIQLSDDHQQDDSTSSLETDVDTGVNTVNSGDAPVEKVRIGVSDESRKVLTDLYKHVIMAAADSVHKKLQSVIAQELQLDYTKQACIQTFVSKCLEVSWLMVMQTPTVHINFDSRSGEKLERDKYKAFTIMGKTIDYIVWPSVYLHEGGPLLTKGIAQGLRL